VVVKHLLACYQSADPKFSLAPVHADASEQVKAATKEDMEASATVTKVIPRL
jgi:hypothetical protein